MNKQIISFVTVFTTLFSFVLFFSSENNINIITSAYDANSAISYADKYWSNYNSNYSNYNSIGGDCANFVSQCLVAGGMQMTNGWYWYSYSNRSASWASCPYMYEYFNSAGYQIIENPSDSQIIEGNPVLYYSSSKGRWSHAAICTGHDSSGNALVSAHNSNRHNVNWKLGTSWSKRCTIVINDGSTPDPPTYSVLNINKSNFSLGEEVYFTASSDLATGYTIGINKDDTRIITQDLNGASFSFTPSECGTYTAYVTAWNKAGLKDSDVISFNIYDSSPKNPLLQIKDGKWLFAEDEVIEFIASSSGSTGYTIGIDKNGKRIVTKDLNGNTFSFVPQGEGDYYSYVSAWNSLGLTDSEGIWFKVYNSPPTVSEIILNKEQEIYEVGNEIEFTATSDTATGYTIGIDKDGERVITKDFKDNTFSFIPSEPGNYYTYVTSWNKYGILDSKGISFKVCDSSPTFSELFVSENIVGVGEELEFTAKSDNANVFWIGIDHNGERYQTEKMTNGKLICTFDEIGEYTAYVTSSNKYGGVDSKLIHFTICSSISGDCNNDGEFTIADTIMLQRWLLADSTKLTNWKGADLNQDGVIDGFDLALLKHLLLASE